MKGLLTLRWRNQRGSPVNFKRTNDPFAGIYTEHCSAYQAGMWSGGFHPGEMRLLDRPETGQERNTQPKRRVRADALRNEDAVLQAAKEIFTTSGVDAPVREIAAKAGVGMGTLYRRFPKRSDLVAGVFRREVDACTAEAAALAAEHPPGDALARWLKRYAGFLATKKGLAAALHSGDPAFDALPDYFRASFEPALTSLMDAAVLAGEVRGSIEPYDLLRAIGNLSVAAGDEGVAHAQRMLELLIDGLRYGAAVRQDR